MKNSFKKIITLIGFVCLAALITLACSNGNEPKEPDVPEEKPPYKPPVTKPDPPPVDMGFTIEGTTNYKITWDAVEDAASYEIYRGPSRLSRNYNLLTIVTGTEYTDTSPNPEKYANYYRIEAKDDNGTVISTRLVSWEIFIFGPNTYFYDIYYDEMSDIAADVNYIHNNITYGEVNQGDGRYAEFSSRRFALYFKPGEYSQPTLNIGFYTQIAGLGDIPSKVKFTGSGNIATPPFLQVPVPDRASRTFWRSIENLQYGSDAGTGGTLLWGVAQAAPMRRIYSTRPVRVYYSGWCSGGYTADCRFTSSFEAGHQQQWYTRNTHLANNMSGVSHNNVLQGMSGRETASSITCSGIKTLIPSTPIIREKPFLYWDEGYNDYRIFVPAYRYDAVGPSWTLDYMGDGDSLGIDEFYFAKEGDTAATINYWLDKGKHIFFTPGIYYAESPIRVKNAGTVLLGTGYVTIIPENSYGAVFIEDVSEVIVAGLTFDASDYNSIYLLCAGELGSNKNHSSAPTLLSDVFIRAGGYFFYPTHVDISVMINSNNVIGDHFWLWRANILAGASGPHYTNGETINGIGWEKNTTRNGLVVTGDDVTVYGLFNEHYQEYNTIWMGERGQMYFYQYETPYDVPRQADWMSHGGTKNGWTAYKVANEVDEHLAVGLGNYAVFTEVGELVTLQTSMEVPNKPGVEIIGAYTTRFSTLFNSVGISTVINDAGNSSNNSPRIYKYVNGTAYTNSGLTQSTTGHQQPPDEELLPWLAGMPLAP